MSENVSDKAAARDTSDAGAELLGRHHQGIGEEHRPGDAVAKLSARLTVGADARRIVVGCAGNQSGPQCLKQARLAPGRRQRRFPRRRRGYRLPGRRADLSSPTHHALGCFLPLGSSLPFQRRALPCGKLIAHPRLPGRIARQSTGLRRNPTGNQRRHVLKLF